MSDTLNEITHSRKRHRGRRRVDRSAISAHLLLDDRIKDGVGTLSEDLIQNLFPDAGSIGINQQTIYHVAITPWLPSCSVAPTSASWTILPARAPDRADGSTNRPHSSLRISPSMQGLQSFIHILQTVAPTKTPRRDTPIEIRIFSVVPIGLDTVFVTLDTEELRKLDEVHAKFGGGFDGSRLNGINKISRDRLLKTNGNSRDTHTAEQTNKDIVWSKAVRDALKSPFIVHTGDMLHLPLPAHPITHVPPPPARITACEPVAQGLLLPTTRIVILQSHRGIKPIRILPSSRQPSISSGYGEEEGEDTSNEQFYSAAEERGSSQNNTPPDGESTDNLDSDMSGSDAGDLSDDSEDIISLNAPLLPPQSSGVLSAFSSATPRPGNFLTNGIATPGSVFSSFTATTTRGGAPSKGRVFKAQGLLQAIDNEMLYPKPAREDDSETRVFVDTNTLVKVGCFSGDWVRIEVAPEPSQNPLWALGAFGGVNEDQPEWRPAKLFGLPESMIKKVPRYPVVKNADFERRPSFSGFAASNIASQAYLSPITLANLGNPSHLRITPLAPPAPTHLPRNVIHKPRLASTALPPLAKEVTLLKLSTPLSSDRVLQPSLFAALKEYFEQKRRIVKTGDLIGISIDETLGRATFQATTTEDDVGGDELLAEPNQLDGEIDNHLASGFRKAHRVSWFKIGNAVASTVVDSGEIRDLDPWGGVVVVDATSTKMEMNGSEQSRTPASLSSTWQYYLGAKRPPVALSPRASILDETPRPYISALRRRLRELISVATSPRAIHLRLPPIAVLITSTQRGIGKSSVAEKACEDLGLHVFPIDAFDILTEGGSGGGDVKTEGFLKARAERALSCGAEFTALLIKHIDALDADRMNAALKDILADSRVLIATTTEVDKVSEGVRGIFTHEIEMNAPDEGEREGILRSIVDDAGLRLSPEVDLANVAVKTAALVAGDLVDVVDRAVVAKSTRLEALATLATQTLSSAEPVTTKDIELAGGSFTNSLTKPDFDAAVEAARKNFADSIGAPKIPNVSWSDVGGLTHVKDAVMETIQLPLARPELFAKGMKKRSGILFYGPPGTGKTLLAKAIATEFSLNFFSVKGPELLNMYIGESEANVRRVFQRARDARPCAVFFDELDSVAPKRGNQGDSGGVMDRIVSQLLAELDGMSDGGEGGGGVFVIGATNRPDLLDQALLRPGRFDKMLYLGVSDTHDKQQTILEALTRKFTMHPQLSLKRVASNLPFTYTGADMYALCSDAMLKAITRQARAVDQKVKAYNATNAQQISTAYFFDHLATEEDTGVLVTEEDFVEANKELVPSVSADEISHYERVRRTFEGAGKKEDQNGITTMARTQSSLQVGMQENGAGDGDDYVIRTDHLELNGNENGSGSGSKGKGKASVNHDKGKSSIDIAEGGFGSATQDDEELYT
ncbi:AAA-domain-containing protein [Aaosphaeria arxii CBS 175.79]|uniref:Peroxisomal ATPase PEX6 n=1 Tax=Aaosphaeria arxii CBS 175.79 TaxID=1450172 RepID=A0A6A5XIJ1_9PLEO|nr:AAA-domain-containing protein [Aaosphaeria arxii CBS 175.79]KAF2013095.1 AAA-domain-containing protein [Aaosphaeria arxii CBS 175.79]